MYFLKNCKELKNSNEIIGKSSSALENKSNNHKDPISLNSDLVIKNIKLLEEKSKVTNQFEKVESRDKINVSGIKFSESKSKLREIDSSNDLNIKNHIYKKNDHFTIDIKDIANHYKRNLHTSNERKIRENALVKTIKLKSLESDIFFKNCEEKLKKLNRNANLKRASSESNIFFLKNKGMINDRSSEKYFYYPKQQIYGTTTISNSEWCPNTENKSILNFSNTEYLLFNPEKKNLSKTKDSIQTVAKVNPVFKQKSISESLDIFGNTCFNPNKNFVEISNNHPNAFFKNSECCSTFLDLHRNYGALFPKPFTKKIV